MTATAPANRLANPSQTRTTGLERRTSLPALTGIRFFAAFYVVLFHALPWLDAHFHLPWPLVIFLSNGYLAVALFFLLSGFILSYTYEGHLECLQQWARFWEARFARIYPVYFLSLLLALPFQLHLSTGARVSVIAMVQTWNPFHREWMGAWNYPAWSLSVEAFFYLCFPFIQRQISKVSDHALLLFALAMALLCIFGHTPTQGLGNWDQTSVYSVFLILPVLRLPEFLLGVALGNRFLRLGVSSNSSIYTYLSAIAVIVSLSVPIGPWVSLVVIPFAALIYDLADSRNQLAGLLSTRVMILLGGASYSVYLLQAPFRDWVRILSARAPFMMARFATPATPFLLVVFSIVVFKFWEEPSRRAIRRWFGAKASSF